MKFTKILLTLGLFFGAVAVTQGLDSVNKDVEARPWGKDV